MKMKAHLYALLGSTELEVNMAERLDRLYEWGTLGIPEDSQPAGLNVAVAHVLRDNSLFPDGYQQVNGACGGGAQVWTSPGQTSWVTWQQALLCEGIYACYRMIADNATYSTEAARGLEVAQKMGKAILLYGYRPRGTEFGSMFGFDLLHNPSSLGDAPDWSWEPTTRYCNSGTSQLDDPYGPLNPDRSNVPYYRDNPSGAFRYSTLPGALIGAALNPTDSAVQAAVAEKLSTGKIFAGSDAIRAGSANANYPVAWHQIAAVIPQPFTRWTAGPVTYQASGRATIASFSASATPTVNRVYQASGSATIATFTATGSGYIGGVTHQASGSATIATFGASASPTVSRMLQASGSATIATFGASGNWSSRTTSTGVVDVPLPGGGGGGGGGGDDDTPTPDPGQTIRELIGPDLARARSVKLMRGPNGPLRVSMPRAYKGRIRRDY